MGRPLAGCRPRFFNALVLTLKMVHVIPGDTVVFKANPVPAQPQSAPFSPAPHLPPSFLDVSRLTNMSGDGDCRQELMFCLHQHRTLHFAGLTMVC
jgi:hypothetical protein